MSLPLNWNRTGEYFIPYRLLMLARMIERETTRFLQVECDISAAEWQVLALACSYGQTSAAEVSATFGTDAAQVSRTVLRMIKAGFIEREFGKNNRKQKKITVTEKGQVLFERARGRRVAFFSWILQDLSVEERSHFNAMLDSIAYRVVDYTEADE
jgi:DNA-binding MarR family transcriptional regulator